MAWGARAYERSHHQGMDVLFLVLVTVYTFP
jgi:hypothetical protein